MRRTALKQQWIGRGLIDLLERDEGQDKATGDA